MKIILYFDKYYILPTALIALCVIYLNYHAALLHEILPYYRTYKEIILSGFDFKTIESFRQTFPMWGYGWVLCVFESKLFLLIAQNILALAAVFLFIRRLERDNIVGENRVRWLKLLTAVSVPWHAFHSLRWPNSPAVSLFLISFIIFHQVVLSKKQCLKKTIFSGIVFGLSLNFRSDYYPVPLFFVTVALWVKRLDRQTLKKCLLWLASIYLTLVPWMLYSKQAVGHYSLGSSNAGHVFFMGLGRLPDNKWGITPRDGDPVMYSFIEEHFGKKVFSLSYEGDRFLKHKFFQLIKEDPFEFWRKCLRSFKEMLTWGVYAGEFYQKKECFPDCKGKLSKSQVRKKLFEPLWFFREGKAFLSLVFFSIYGGAIILVSFLCLPAAIVRAVREKNLFFALLTTSILYQALINVLADNQRFYTSNMYFFHLINFIGGVFAALSLSKKILSKS